MTAQIIDGKAFAKGLNDKTAEKVTDFASRHGFAPALSVILVGDDPASQIYVRNKAKIAKKLGIKSDIHTLPPETDQETLIELIETLNSDQAVHGILVQLPLPDHIDRLAVQAATAPEKDVDAFHPLNIGRRILGRRMLVPCTPKGCLMLIKSVDSNLTGKKAVVIGRSQIVGQPMADLLGQEDCTVTICHEKTVDLTDECRTADILVCATGVAGLVKGDWVKEGAIVIDVGITRLEDGRLTGDVDFETVKTKARAITPVPGGVGPMTIACLMQNALTTAENQA